MATIASSSGLQPRATPRAHDGRDDDHRPRAAAGAPDPAPMVGGLVTSFLLERTVTRRAGRRVLTTEHSVMRCATASRRVARTAAPVVGRERVETRMPDRAAPRLARGEEESRRRDRNLAEPDDM